MAQVIMYYYIYTFVVLFVLSTGMFGSDDSPRHSVSLKRISYTKEPISYAKILELHLQEVSRPDHNGNTLLHHIQYWAPPRGRQATGITHQEESYYVSCVSPQKIEQNKYHALDELLAAGVSPNIQNNKGNTPLHNACKEKKLEIVTLYLKHKANPNLANNKKEYALDVALKITLNEEVIQALIDKRAELHPATDISTLLHNTYRICLGNYSILLRSINTKTREEIQQTIQDINDIAAHISPRATSSPRLNVSPQRRSPRSPTSGTTLSLNKKQF